MKNECSEHVRICVNWKRSTMPCRLDSTTAFMDDRI